MVKKILLSVIMEILDESQVSLLWLCFTKIVVFKVNWTEKKTKLEVNDVTSFFLVATYCAYICYFWFCRGDYFCIEKTGMLAS
jgi:amino acid permease